MCVCMCEGERGEGEGGEESIKQFIIPRTLKKYIVSLV